MKQGLIAFTGMIAVAFAAHGQATPWQDHAGKIRTRIIAAPDNSYSGDGALYAWEAELEPGWKTYWRSPGEAGLPVVLKAEGEEALDLLYPTPNRFNLFDIETFGYSKALVLPFEVADPSQPLSLQGEFMVCKDICIPFVANYSVPADLPSGAGFVEQTKVDTWLTKVPVRTEAGSDGLAITDVTIAGSVGRQKVVLTLAAETVLDGVDILGESTSGLMFSKPRVRLTGDRTTARVVLDAVTGRVPVDLHTETLRFTVILPDGHAIDRTFDAGS